MGEASLPGPRQKSPDLASLLSINVGGAPGAWRLFEENCSEALVICLQEINMKPDEWTAYPVFINLVPALRINGGTPEPLVVRLSSSIEPYPTNLLGLIAIWVFKV